mmetsp:Transcript_1630/g.1970  ORF Transcript_1630/g.1970 Transcript_1630/m.1970 type:complete len:144 (+) Transcript_1630:125-556(+)
MALPTGVATLYFPSSTLQAYTHKGSIIELIFSDSRFSTPIGETKIIDQIIVEPENALRGGGVNLRYESRRTLTGTGFALSLSTVTGEKKQLSPLWRTQIMFTMLQKLGEYGYSLSSVTEEKGAQTFFFKEERTVMDELFGPRN